MNIVLLMPFIFIFGYLFKHFYKDLSGIFIKVIIGVFVPVLVIFLFQGLLINQSIIDVIMFGYITAIIGIVISLVIAKIYNLDRRTLSALIIAMAFGNTSFLGIPYIEAYYGSQGLQYLAFFDILGTSVPIFIVSTLLNSYCNNEKISILELAKIPLKPPILAIFVGLYFKDIPLPENIYNTMSFMTSSIAPLSIFTIGMKFSFIDFKKELFIVLGILSVKMFITPFLIFCIIYLFFDISLMEYKVSIIESALPPMILGSVLAIRYDFRSSLVVGSATLGVLIAFVSIPFLHYLLENL